MTPCAKIKEQLSAYVDRELDTEHTHAIAAHLEQCTACAAAAQNELTMKAVVHERTKNFVAPVALRRRIQRDLENLGTRYNFWQSLRDLWALHPLPAFAATAALILCTSVITYISGIGIANNHNPQAFITNASIEGTLVCADCQLMLATQTPCVHDASAHRLVLRTTDGHLWNIVQSAPGRELVRSLRENSPRVRTEGFLFQRAGYIQVTNFKVLQN